ncbi:OPT oligopeptide transporter protein-domain-containing protein [Emericellopsis atlantica]|uniref:OPT oligopeptide transporter protein-domain-containing protein n=1 Tax=Emericellopsis atlantica TaxID=2614577 RepID=A0A9P7ZG47_9HYPO|nr:OPT oligopeptide transporter protein-domain-containing protein [Emericellopsis atlantica]KAG9251498.1 OPT oligopeptide transporter protein-domain-containing protein [Emericellopsis atlantica]
MSNQGEHVHPVLAEDMSSDSGKPGKLGTFIEYAEKPTSSGDFPPVDWYERLKAEYTGQHAGETFPAGCDPNRMAQAILTLNETESVKVLEELLETQRDDYTIDQRMLARVRELIQGHEACEMEQGEWSYEVCKRAGLYRNWSPYAEVRAVTLPYDDPNEACESFRAYVLGYFWVCVCTMVNTFFSPRQPGISIPGSVVQLLLVPMGRGMAWLLPDWGFRFRGTRYTINPGPWTSKEQLFATIIFTGASSIGNFTGLLVLRMPVFFNQRWATFGKGVSFSWWGNDEPRAGVDFQLYNNNASLYKVPEGGFGLAPEDYPRGW